MTKSVIHHFTSDEGTGAANDDPHWLEAALTGKPCGLTFDSGAPVEFVANALLSSGKLLHRTVKNEPLRSAMLRAARIGLRFKAGEVIPEVERQDALATVAMAQGPCDEPGCRFCRIMKQ